MREKLSQKDELNIYKTVDKRLIFTLTIGWQNTARANIKKWNKCHLFLIRYNVLLISSQILEVVQAAATLFVFIKFRAPVTLHQLAAIKQQLYKYVRNDNWNNSKRSYDSPSLLHTHAPILDIFIVPNSRIEITWN